jgi:hypothetical protein
MATDNFNRIDAADIGATWDVMTTETAFEIASNAAAPQNPSADCGETYNGVTFANNQYSQVTLANSVSTGGAGTGVGVTVRASAVARTYYRVVCASAGTELGVMNAGSYTALKSDATAWTVGDTVRLEVSGTSLTVKRNGSTISALSTTDSAIASGRAGIANSGISSAGVRVDDWDGGDLVAGSSSVSPSVSPSVSASVSRSPSPSSSISPSTSPTPSSSPSPSSAGLVIMERAVFDYID